MKNRLPPNISGRSLLKRALRRLGLVARPNGAGKGFPCYHRWLSSYQVFRSVHLFKPGVEMLKTLDEVKLRSVQDSLGYLGKTPSEQNNGLLYEQANKIKRI